MNILRIIIGCGGHDTSLGRVQTDRTTKQCRPRSTASASDRFLFLSPRVGLDLDAVEVKLKLIERNLQCFDLRPRRRIVERIDLGS